MTNKYTRQGVRHRPADQSEESNEAIRRENSPGRRESVRVDTVLPWLKRGDNRHSHQTQDDFAGAVVAESAPSLGEPNICCFPTVLDPMLFMTERLFEEYPWEAPPEPSPVDVLIQIQSDTIADTLALGDIRVGRSQFDHAGGASALTPLQVRRVLRGEQ